VAGAANRQRTQDLLDAAVAARAGQASQDAFKKFTGDLRKQLK